ncbi:hypothetical protein LCGC14_0462510 [marine sediment metagenome]|uniref:Uncharacterized protein n=1 Tax=marine sediment metagenome TaxID=412755 RepID=A0A0F9SXP0_9ZZZZ
MEIIKGVKWELGECQFCDREKYYVVYEIRGKSTIARFCCKCLKEAKEKK